MRNIISILFCLLIGIANSLCAENYKGDKTRKEVTSLSKEQESPMLLREPHYDVQQNENHYDDLPFGIPMPRDFSELYDVSLDREQTINSEDQNQRAHELSDASMEQHVRQYENAFNGSLFDIPMPCDFNDVVSQESKGNVVPVAPVVSKEKKRLQNYGEINRVETKNIKKKHRSKKNTEKKIKIKKTHLSRYKNKVCHNDYGLYKAVEANNGNEVKRILDLRGEQICENGMSNAFMKTLKGGSKKEMKLKITDIFLDHPNVPEKLSCEVVDRAFLKTVSYWIVSLRSKILKKDVLRKKLCMHDDIKEHVENGFFHFAKGAKRKFREALLNLDLKRKLEHLDWAQAFLDGSFEDYMQIKIKQRMSWYLRKGTGNDFGLYDAVDAGEDVTVQQILKTYHGQLHGGDLSDAFHRSMIMKKKDLCQKIAEMFLEYSDVKEKLSKEVLDRVVMKAITKSLQDLFYKIVRDPVLRAKLYRRSDTRDYFDVALMHACKRGTYFLKEILSHSDLRQRLSRTIKEQILNNKTRTKRVAKQFKKIVALLQYDLENGIYSEEIENLDGFGLLEAAEGKSTERIQQILAEHHGELKAEIVISAFGCLMLKSKRDAFYPEIAELFLNYQNIKEMLNEHVLDQVVIKTIFFGVKDLFFKIIRDPLLRSRLYKSKRDDFDTALRYASKRAVVCLDEILLHDDLRQRLSRTIKEHIVEVKTRSKKLAENNKKIVALLQYELENGIYGQAAEESGNTQETQQIVDVQLRTTTPSMQNEPSDVDPSDCSFDPSMLDLLDELFEETPRQQEQQTVVYNLPDAVKARNCENVQRILYDAPNRPNQDVIIQAFVQTMQGKEKEDVSPEVAKIFLGHPDVKGMLSGDALDFVIVKSMYYDFKPLFSTIIQDRVLRAKLYKNKATKEKIDNALRHVLHDEYYMKKIMQHSPLRKRLSVAIKHDILKRQAMAEVFWGGNCDVLELLLRDVEYRTVLEEEREPLSKILYFINETFMKGSEEAQKAVDKVMRTFCKHMDLEERIEAISEEQDFTFILTRFNDV